MFPLLALLLYIAVVGVGQSHFPSEALGYSSCLLFRLIEDTIKCLFV